MSAKKNVFVAVTNDISTDQRIDKVCRYLLTKNFNVYVYGRVLPDTFPITREYSIVRKKHWFNHNFWFYAEYNIRLFFHLLFYKCDYILANDLDTLPACFFASKLKKATLVYDSHELFSEGPELQGRKFVQGFWRRLEQFFLPRVKQAYTVSESIAEYYQERYQNNMGVIRNIPPLHRKMLRIAVRFPTKNKVILYQGVLNPGRGIKPMIKALEYLEGVDLVIIGFGKVKEELEAFVRKEQKEDRVHFLGRIPYEKLPNYTMLADIGMVLEEPLGKSFEYALPNKLFDYIHAEIPIIAGNLPEVKRIVESYKVGEIVTDYSPKSIAKTVRLLIEDITLRTEIKRHQKKAKELLCWEKEQQQLDKYFKNE